MSEANKIKAFVSRKMHECGDELEAAQREPDKAARPMCELKARWELAAQIMQGIVEISEGEEV